jgi:hypothetical protein
MFNSLSGHDRTPRSNCLLAFLGPDRLAATLGCPALAAGVIRIAVWRRVFASKGAGAATETSRASVIACERVYSAPGRIRGWDH